MTLRIHNTMSREKEDFKPLQEGKVGMYVCGPTVYDLAHIGNARPVVVFDVLYRLLKNIYGEGNVKYVRNITDVDDKINAKAQETGEDIATITERTTKIFHADMAALGALPPDEEPRATQHIKEMIALTEALIDKGHAYKKEDHVLFSVTEWDDYGKLSGNSRDEIIAGARVEVAPYKKDDADFVLWKPSKEADLPGWDTPWGRCRPGWHLECSAMSKKHLGEKFDIHGGGQDLIFPHHENEIAQSRCAHSTDLMAKYWMHNGYLLAEGEKMSKSLGNFYTVHDLLKEFPGEAIRLALLKTHYRQPLDFTKDGIRKAGDELNKLYKQLLLARDAGVELTPAKKIPIQIIEVLKDDLNTPKALFYLHEIASNLSMANQVGRTAQQHKDCGQLLAAGDILGILQQDPEDWFKWQPPGSDTLDAESIEGLTAEYETARFDKDFARSDEIRDRLAAEGIVLETNADGITDWRRK